MVPIVVAKKPNLCIEDVGSNPAGKLFIPQQLSNHIPNPSLHPLRRRRGRLPSEILQNIPKKDKPV
jgi:hypothetical protein